MTSKDIKHDIVASLSELIDKNSYIFAIDYTGLKAQDTRTVRKIVRQNNSSCIVAKNTLVRIAMKNSNVECVHDTSLKGQAMLFFTNDPTVIAKLIITSGISGIKPIFATDKNAFFEPQYIKRLSEIEDISVLKAKLLGVLQAPCTKLLRVLNATQEGLVRVLSKKSEI